MNKGELIERVADATGEAKSRVGDVLDAAIKAVQTAVQEGEKVTIPGFGSFESRRRAERTGRNPRTGESMRIPATTIPVFKAGQVFKDLVRGKAKLTVRKTAKSSSSRKRPSKSTGGPKR
jgi:DNA-binding protein HU-beta